MIVDAHLHLEPELPAEQLVRTMDDGGVDRAVLIAAAQVPVGRVAAGAALFRGCMSVRALRPAMIGLATTFKPKAHERPDNAAVFAAAAAHPDRFFPFAFVNPRLGAEAHEELDRWIGGGARGVKLHPWMHGYRLPGALEVLRRAEDARLPVLVHLGAGTADDVRAVLDACPKLRLIVAHAGIPHFERLWGIDRLFFDVSSPRTILPGSLVQALVQTAGAPRVLFASDGPVGLRVRGGYRYPEIALPERAYGDNLVSLID